MTNPFTDAERLAIHTSDGLGLRAEYRASTADSGARPRALAVLCHPHPLHGGNMHNHVVSGLFAALPALGVPTMRFNFRGTSGSEGRHGGGETERFDVEAAIDAVTARHQDGRPIPLVLIGYSFGALVALSVEHRAVSGWLAVAPPLTMIGGTVPAASGDTRPTLIVTGTDDDFCPAADAERLTSDWTTTWVLALPGEDHFLATATDKLQAEAESFVADLTAD